MLRVHQTGWKPDGIAMARLLPMTGETADHLALPELSSPPLSLLLLFAQAFQFPVPGCQLSLPPGFLPVYDKLIFCPYLHAKGNIA